MAGNPLYALCWIVLLFFVAWPVAALCSGLWIILQVRTRMMSTNYYRIVGYSWYAFLNIVSHMFQSFLYFSISQPFEACFPVISDCNSFLEKFVTWPRDCGSAIFSCSNSCPQP
jgi:hypothetical protein